MFIKKFSPYFLLLVFILSAELASAAPTSSCTVNKQLIKTFSSGATWKFCIDNHPQAGLTLAQVYYGAPNKALRRVLGEAGLAQLQLIPDTATTAPYLLTQQGLGKNIQALTKTDCPNGNLKAVDGVLSICRSTQEYGYHYKYETQRQGSFFELLSAYNLTPYTYYLRWRFYENGNIEPALGISGNPLNSNATETDNFTLHAAWRLDFDLGASADDDQILETTSTATEDRLQKKVSITTLNKEAGRKQDPEIKRSWIIRDGTTPYEGLVIPAYDIIPSQYNTSQINSLNADWLQRDIYFSKYNACERYAADNTLDQCPAEKNNLKKFVADKENINSADIVVWYRQSTHHLTRSENRVRLGVVWSSFQLTPRDWHSQNQF